jgi:hypothetical protein
VTFVCWFEVSEACAGTTTYVIDPETGLIVRHLDTWDSIDNQKYFSVEGFADVLSQIFNFERTPDLPTAKFTLLKYVSAISCKNKQLGNQVSLVLLGHQRGSVRVNY